MSLAMQLLLAVAPYLVPAIVAAAVVLVKAYLEKLPSNQRSLIVSVVRSAVNATEQVATTQMPGANKRQMALDFIEAQLQHFHINVPEPVINAMLEEAVRALNTRGMA